MDRWEEDLVAGDWIKVRTDLPDDPAVFLIAATLGLDQDLVVGKLLRLWSWADRHTSDGEVPLPSSWIDRFLGMVGFADAMAGAGWLVIREGAFTIPKFDRHNGAGAKRRCTESLRKARNRAGIYSEGHVRKMSAVDADKSGTREEKRREERVDTSYLPESPSGSPRARARETAPGAPWVEPDLPGELDTLAFRSAWKRWLDYRRERRLPGLRAVSVRQKLRELAGWGEPAAIEAIDQSIGNGWQGLFRPKAEAGRFRPETPTEKVQRALRELGEDVCVE